MASRIFRVNNLAQMQAFGLKLAQRLNPGDLVALIGELGSGKTTLVQCIAAAWGYKRQANSPTFALANEYATPRGRIYHMDMYRLSSSELSNLPLEDYWGRGLCLIEWADKVFDRLPPSAFQIRLKIVSPDKRSIQLILPKKRRVR